MSGSGRKGSTRTTFAIRATTEAALVGVRHAILKKWVPGGKRAVVGTPQHFASLIATSQENWREFVFDLNTGHWILYASEDRRRGVGLAELGCEIFQLPVATVARLLGEVIGGGNRSRPPGDGDPSSAV